MDPRKDPFLCWVILRTQEKNFGGSKHLMPISCYFSSYLAPFPLVSSIIPSLCYLQNETSENQKYLFCLSVGSRRIMTALASIS